MAGSRRFTPRSMAGSSRCATTASTAPQWSVTISVRSTSSSSTSTRSRKRWPRARTAIRSSRTSISAVPQWSAPPPRTIGYVTVLTDPADYGALLTEIEAQGGATSEAFRIRMAGKAYARTAAYDAAIANWFAYDDAFTHPLGAGSARRDAVRCDDAASLHPVGRAAIWREPAPVGGNLPAAGVGRTRYPAGRAIAGQGAQLQQLQRCRCRARTGGGIRRGRSSLRDCETRQSVRRRAGRIAARSVGSGARLRQRLRIRRDRGGELRARRCHRQGDRRHLHRGRDRADRIRRSARAAREEEKPARARMRRAARSAAGWLCDEKHCGRPADTGPRQCHDRAATI